MLKLYTCYEIDDSARLMEGLTPDLKLAMFRGRRIANTFWNLLLWILTLTSSVNLLCFTLIVPTKL
jgi:hypothetical protein